MAVANYMGLNAIGVEIKPNLCRNAASLQVDEANQRNNFVWKKVETKDASKTYSEENEIEHISYLAC